MPNIIIIIICHKKHFPITAFGSILLILFVLRNSLRQHSGSVFLLYIIDNIRKLFANLLHLTRPFAVFTVEEIAPSKVALLLAIELYYQPRRALFLKLVVDLNNCPPLN